MPTKDRWNRDQLTYCKVIEGVNGEAIARIIVVGVTVVSKDSECSLGELLAG